MSDGRSDKLIPCCHSCCKKEKNYRHGQSSAWRNHIRTRTAQIHNDCNEACPGWKNLSENIPIVHMPSISTNQEPLQRDRSLRSANQALLRKDGPPISTDEVDLQRDQVFTLLWILDPTSRGKTIEEIQGRIEWTTVSVDPTVEDMLSNPKLNGYIFRSPEGKALMCDYVSTFLSLRIETLLCFDYSSVFTGFSQPHPTRSISCFSQSFRSLYWKGIQ